MLDPAPPVAGRRAAYRHGNLRAAAAAAAYGLASEGGPKAVTLRAVAGRVGVAHRSLYNHFQDREALLDAVAERYFLERAEAVAGAETPGDFVRGYVRYALANPHIYAIGASRSHATMPANRPLHDAAHLLIRPALKLFGSPDQDADANRRSVMKVLILLHGAISWRLAGVLDVPDDEALIGDLQAMVASG